VTDPNDLLANLQDALDAYAADANQSVTALRIWLKDNDTERASLLTRLAELQQQVSPPPLPTGWGRTVFFENFIDPTTALAKFNVRNATTQNNTSCNNFAANVSVRNGQLVLTGKRETTTVNVSGGGTRTCDYTSGYVDTGGGKLSIAKGSRIEIAAVVPTVLDGQRRGIWPAAWLRDNVGSGEIDIMEAWGEPTTRPAEYRSGSFSSSIYKDTNVQGAGKVSNWGTPAGAAPVGGVLHTYWCEWDNVGIRIGMDSNTPHVTAKYSTVPWLATSFPSTLQLRLNLQIGSAYWGQPDDTTAMPVEYRIDSVRVLQP
jgi:hypothetical protein